MSITTLLLVGACTPSRPSEQPPQAILGASSDSLYPAVAIAAVQGARHRSSMVGQLVTLTGVITHCDQRRSYWLQTLTPDSAPATSEAIKLRPLGKYLPSATVADQVQVQGTIHEIIHRQSPSGLPMTTMRVERLTVLRQNVSLPAPIMLGRSGRAIPTAFPQSTPHSTVDSPQSPPLSPKLSHLDFWESLEGMRVSITNPRAVSGLRYGNQCAVVADGGADANLVGERGIHTTITGRQPPIILSLNAVNDVPYIAVGHQFTGTITGIVDYRHGMYRIIVTDPLPTGHRSSLAPEATHLQRSRDHLTIATFNVRNLSPKATFPGGRSRIAAIARIIDHHLCQPDIIAMQEIQDDSGATNDGTVSALTGYRTLIEQITGTRYNYYDVPPTDLADGGRPGANIRNAFLYASNRVTLLPPRHSDVNPDTRSTTTPQHRLVRHPAFLNSRKPLVAHFSFNGHVIVAINCHFISKHADTPRHGRYQPPITASMEPRVEQAQAVATFARQLLDRSPETNVIVLGDLNDRVDAVALKPLRTVGMENLMTALPAHDQYTYIYRGNAEALDHILASASLTDHAKPEIDIVHINSEFPDNNRASDHDPLVARFFLPAREHVGRN